MSYAKDYGLPIILLNLDLSEPPLPAVYWLYKRSKYSTLQKIKPNFIKHYNGTPSEVSAKT